MFREDGDHTLDAAEDCAMNHNGSSMSHFKLFVVHAVVFGAHILGLIQQLESFREIIIQLDRSTLMFPLQRIRNRNINLTPPDQHLPQKETQRKGASVCTLGP